MPREDDSISENSPKSSPPNAEGFIASWKLALQSLRRLLVDTTKDRLLAPFVSLRNTVLALAESESFTAKLAQAWSTLHSKLETQEIAHIFTMELETVSACVELAEEEHKATDDFPLPKKRLLSAFETVFESGRDLFESFPVVKAVLKALSELAHFFRGE